MLKVLSSLIIVLSFISTIPVPQRFLPEWNSSNLRYFPLMLPVTGLIFSALWLISWQILSIIPEMSSILRGFMMMLFTLTLTGGLHLDGLMDTCDAVFSHRDRDTRLKILSDTHSGSFAVIGCTVILIAKTLLFSELLKISIINLTFLLIPVYSRLGMSIILTNLPFAKSDGLAVMLGSSRHKSDNIFFTLMFIILIFLDVSAALIFILCLFIHVLICLKIFGGITGDLLGAFVEFSEVIMLFGTVIKFCI